MLKKILVVLFLLITTKILIVNAVTTEDIPNYTPPKIESASKTTIISHKIALEPSDYIKTIISSNAEKYNVDSIILTNVIKCESSFVTNARGDGGHSRGLAQIHNIYHPEVTDEMADNPEFAIDFMAKNIASGKGSQWTCYRTLYSS